MDVTLATGPRSEVRLTDRVTPDEHRMWPRDIEISDDLTHSSLSDLTESAPAARL
jgi:hypothetical protein